MTENENLHLSPEQAIGVAISVLPPCEHMEMSECQLLVPNFLRHLNAMGYELNRKPGQN